MNEAFLRPLIWMDYRLAVLLMVSLPLVLLLWATLKRNAAITKLLLIYWKVASLWMISVYLMIPSWELSFFTGAIARILIPIALWFWVDLNDEIHDMPNRGLKIALTTWRWATTLYCIFGTVLNLRFLPCSLGASIDEALCKIWFEPPWGYKAWFHGDSTPGFLGFIGGIGLFFYVLYFSYFVLVRLGKEGRSALEQ